MPIVPAIAVVLFSANLLGQAQVQQPGAQRATPARDPTTQNPRGTSALKGTVVEAGTGKPLRRANVSLTFVDPPGTRKSVSTGLDGTYEFRGLPAGTYRISVTRGGYLPVDYGQRRPGELGRPVDVSEGSVLDKLDFALPRMGVITGRISDERGDPIEGVVVLAMRSLYSSGSRTLVPIGGANVATDDAGEYRIPRLPPGTYYVMASTKETWKAVENGKETLLGYVPTYFPGVPTAGEARRVSVGIGQQVFGIDLGLIAGRTARVSGHAVDSEGKPFKQASLNQEIRGLDFGSFRGGPSASIAGDGSFTILDVPPGDYVLTAMRNDSEGAPEVAQTAVTVDGTDIENVSLAGSAGGTVTGRVMTDDAGLDLHTVRLTIGPIVRGQVSPSVLGAFRNGGFALVNDDGGFSARHVFGRSRFQVSLPAGWIVKSISHGGRDLADSAFELASGEEWTDVEVKVTKRSGTLTGDIANDQNGPVIEATVILFAADNQKWFESSRYVRAARPNQQGQWRFTGLPEGDYLVAAVDYVENGEWNDPEYLTSLRDVSTKVSLSEAGSATAHLKIVVPKQ
jgi:hypothetical protein